MLYKIKAMTDNDEFVCVFKGSTIQINWLKVYLLENNIDCFSRDKSMEAAHSGFASPVPDDVQLFVKTDDAKKAKELLELNKDSIQEL